MSQRRAPQVVIEWSPNHVAWVGADGRVMEAPSLVSAAAHVDARDVVIAFSRRSTFIRAYRVPPASKGEVRRILEMQLGQLFPAPASELAFDFHLTEDSNQEGRLAIIAAVRVCDLTQMFSDAKAAGFRVTQVVPVALGSSVLAKSMSLTHCAVAHRVADGLAIDLVAGGELRYSRVAPLPTSALAMEAEVGRTFAAAALSCAPTVAAGGLALPDAEISTDSTALSALLGALLDIDLQTPEQRAAKTRSNETRRLRWSLLLFGAALIMATAYYLDWSDAQASAHHGDAVWNRKLSQARATRDRAADRLSLQTSIKQILDGAFHPAQRPSDVLTVAANSAPAGLWITGFSLERGKSLTIRGTTVRSEAVYEYQDSLVNNPRFRDVKLVFANNAQIDNTPVVQFSIQAFPVGNLPLAEATKKGGTKK